MNPRTRSASAALQLSVQRGVDKRLWPLLPSRARILRYVRAALQGQSAQIVVRFVDEAEGRQLNHAYRGKDYATNVLSFSYDKLPGASTPSVCGGDLVLCVPVLRQEATEQAKTLLAHCAHLLVHGVLHLRGFDHEHSAQAEQMEALEAALLQDLGFADPYAVEQGNNCG